MAVAILWNSGSRAATACQVRCGVVRRAAEQAVPCQGCHCGWGLGLVERGPVLAQGRCSGLEGLRRDVPLLLKRTHFQKHMIYELIQPAPPTQLPSPPHHADRRAAPHRPQAAEGWAA